MGTTVDTILVSMEPCAYNNFWWTLTKKHKTKSERLNVWPFHYLVLRSPLVCLVISLFLSLPIDISILFAQTIYIHVSLYINGHVSLFLYVYLGVVSRATAPQHKLQRKGEKEWVENNAANRGVQGPIWTGLWTGPRVISPFFLTISELSVRSVGTFPWTSYSAPDRCPLQSGPCFNAED